jgi:uncharacterized protein
MTFLHMVLLFATAVIGGTLNSVAGGGSFFTFPALTFTGMPYIQANATSTVALWPGSVAGTGAYRKELALQQRGLLLLLVGTSLLGGVLGAILLIHSSQKTFALLLPYLLLMATLLFTFNKQITALFRKSSVEKTVYTPAELISVSIVQLIIAIYGGYFGGGIGILMLATLGMMGMQNIHMMNALKTLLASCINGIAVITFILAGIVVWPQALLMIIGAIIGGYAGAYYARKIEQKWIRLFVMVVGFALTIYFFLYS